MATSEAHKTAAGGDGSSARFTVLAEFAWVVLGGAAGTLLRYWVHLLIGDFAGVPLGILVINVAGSFLLGILLEGLTLHGPDSGSRRRLRLLLGTGVIGGFTTYSLLSADIAAMILRGDLPLGVAYGFVTVIAGVLASWFGVLGARAVMARVRDE